MIVRRYMAWMRTASATARADATATLARAYLGSEMDACERGEAEAALTVALDDDEVGVRLALAETLADHSEAPRHIILALAGDRSEVAELVLQRSPLLSDSELIELAVAGDEAAQVAVARRAFVTAPVAAALAEVAEEAAALALVGNVDAEVPAFSLARIVERFGESAAVRDAVLSRPNAPIDVRLAVMLAERSALARTGRDGGSRADAYALEDAERVAVTLALACDDDDLSALVAHLRTTGRLTAGLMLRALLSGDLRLPTAALANLAGMAERRAAALMMDPRAGGWRALYRKAGLPDSLMPAFASAVSNCREVTAEYEGLGRGPVVARRIVSRVLNDSAVLDDAGAARIVSVLRRFEVEMAREEARLAASMMLDDLAIGRRAPLALAAPAAASAQFEQPVRATAEAMDDTGAQSRADAIRPMVMAAIEDALLLRGSFLDAADPADAPAGETSWSLAQDEAGALVGPVAVATVAATPDDASDPERRPAPPSEDEAALDWADDMIPAAANDQDPIAAVGALAVASPEPPSMTVEARALLRIEEMVAQAYADARQRERAA